MLSRKVCCCVAEHLSDMVYRPVRLRKNFCFENWFCFHHQVKLLRWIHSIDLVCISGQISLIKFITFVISIHLMWMCNSSPLRFFSLQEAIAHSWLPAPSPCVMNYTLLHLLVQRLLSNFKYFSPVHVCINSVWRSYIKLYNI